MRGSHEAQLRIGWNKVRVPSVKIQIILCDISRSFCHGKNFERKLQGSGLGC